MSARSGTDGRAAALEAHGTLHVSLSTYGHSCSDTSKSGWKSQKIREFFYLNLLSEQKMFLGHTDPVIFHFILTFFCIKTFKLIEFGIFLAGPHLCIFSKF